MSQSVTIGPAPHGLTGEMRVPGDKSISHRAVMFAALARGESRIRGCALGQDNLATVRAFESLGVDVVRNGTEHDATLVVHSRGWHSLRPPDPAGATIDCGNSGTTLRLLAGILAGCPFPSRLDGDASLRRRPMGRVMTPLRRMGARIDSEAAPDCAPLCIRGTAESHPRLTGIAYTNPVASAQVKSAVLLAGLYATGCTTVTEPVRSRDHTERLLPAFGVTPRVEGSSVTVDGGARLHAADLDVPGDLSSAAFFLAAALLLPDSELLIRGVGLNPTRTGIVDIFRAMGGDVETRNRTNVGGEPVGDLLVRSSKLHGVEIDGELVVRAIDELPIAAVVMALAHGTSVIRGAEELRVKESDRVAGVAGALAALGVDLDERSDGLVIRGPARVTGGTVHSRSDHRLAMALGVAGLLSRRGIRVQEPACVAVSFPGFFRLLHDLTGAAVTAMEPR